MFFAVDDGLYRDFVGEAVVLSGVIMRTATPTLVASADKIVKSSVCRCLDLEAERKCLNHGQNGAVDHMAGVSNRATDGVDAKRATGELGASHSRGQWHRDRRPTVLAFAGRSISGRPNGWICKRERTWPDHAAVWTSRSTSRPTSRMATARSY
jgi:hypothetical protein